MIWYRVEVLVRDGSVLILSSLSWREWCGVSEGSGLPKGTLHHAVRASRRQGWRRIDADVRPKQKGGTIECGRNETEEIRRTRLLGRSVSRTERQSEIGNLRLEPIVPCQVLIRDATGSGRVTGTSDDPLTCLGGRVGLKGQTRNSPLCLESKCKWNGKDQGLKSSQTHLILRRRSTTVVFKPVPIS